MTTNPTTRGGHTHHGRWCLAGLSIAILWTAVGTALAAWQGVVPPFLDEWWRFQGVPLLALGAWLLLIIRAQILHVRVSALTSDGRVPLGAIARPSLRFGVVGAIALVGTASLISLGFPAEGLVKYFMWLTCAAICLTSGIVTLHVLEIIAVVRNLRETDIKVFRYSPARTPELRDLVGYFSSFTLLVTIGYAFALIATFRGSWMASPEQVNMVRLFWPLIYVPTCSVALVSPHIAVHRIVRQAKDRTLAACQRDIDELLEQYADLRTEDIDRTNTLAQLFDRITGTPDYVVDFGIAVRTALPLVFNLITLFTKVLVDHPIR